MGSESIRDKKSSSAVYGGVRSAPAEVGSGEGARASGPWQTTPQKAGLGQLAERLHGRTREGGFAPTYAASCENLGEEGIDLVLAEAASTWGEQHLLAKWGEARSKELSAETEASYFRGQRKTLELVIDDNGGLNNEIHRHRTGPF